MFLLRLARPRMDSPSWRRLSSKYLESRKTITWSNVSASKPNETTL